MKKFQTRYSNLFLSKFNVKNVNSITLIKKVNFSIVSDVPFKFIFKNLIWILILLSGQCPNFKKQKIKRKTSSKSTLTSFGMTVSKSNFFIIEKFLQVVLPNQENKLVSEVNWGSLLSISFKKCLTHSEFDIILKNKTQVLVKNFNVVLNFKIKNNSQIKDFFVLRFLQFPIKNHV